MIYHHKSPEFQGYLSSGKHTPSTEEVIDALQDLKKKMPGQGLKQQRRAMPDR